MLCTQANICRECDDGFEPGDNGDSCVSTVAESSGGDGLSVAAIIGRRHSRKSGRTCEAYDMSVPTCIPSTLTEVHVTLALYEP